ncbi:MAG TPA: TadE/TadG family type IV pilus assembly protein [Microthrixaceae bacterium]|nr:TadE/TadG family type IV pilus assembly protein [Microthrixaceae bacterium]
MSSAAPRGSCRSRRARGENGAVLVEVVLILPLLMLISLAVFDLGLGWKASMTVTNAARAGARVASNLGVAATADKSALASIAASLGTVPVSEIDVIVIYRATTADGDVPADCLTGSTRATGGSSASQCNVYTGAEAIAASTSTTFTGNCGSSRDRFWCPSTRGNSQAASTGPDYLGVYVRINHTTKTKAFGSTMVVKDRAIMRIEPNAGNP